jgi:hypothetical protein
MSQVQTLTPKFFTTVKPQVRSRRPVRPEAPPALFRCLIVSTLPQRTAMLQQAAEAQGWEPLLCDSAQVASREVIRNRLQMVIVDLDTSGHGAPDGFAELTERLAGESGRLLLVCGNEGDVQEEIWARQLGAWMYLPGVDDQSDVAMLCGEARNVAEKLLGPLAVQWTAT